MIYWILSLMVTVIIIFMHGEYSLYKISKPLEKVNIMYTDLLEPLSTNIYISIWIALLINIPFPLYQSYNYIKPGLYESQLRNMKLIFIYCCIIPILCTNIYLENIWPFLIKLFMNLNESAFLLINLKLFTYVKLYIQSLTCVQSILILPLAILVIPSHYIAKYRLYILFTIYCSIAFILPPDITQFLIIAIPFTIIPEAYILLPLSFGNKLSILVEPSNKN